MYVDTATGYFKTPTAVGDVGVKVRNGSPFWGGIHRDQFSDTSCLFNLIPNGLLVNMVNIYCPEYYPEND
ncbi:hypothetical protein ABVN80_16715 [Acinetobacter baumannii]